MVCHVTHFRKFTTTATYINIYIYEKEVHHNDDARFLR